MYIVIKYRMRYNIIKDLWLYEPRIITNYPLKLFGLMILRRKNEFL